MEFLLLEKDGAWVQKKESFIFYPEFMSRGFLYRWITTCGEVDSLAMCNTLNLINNQGIEYLSLREMGYRIKGKQVSLGCLSTGERIFFCAELARQKETDVYLYKGLNQLMPITQGTFCREFAGCQHIHLLFDNYGQLHMFKKRGDLL